MDAAVQKPRPRFKFNTNQDGPLNNMFSDEETSDANEYSRRNSRADKMS